MKGDYDNPEELIIWDKNRFTITINVRKHKFDEETIKSFEQMKGRIDNMFVENPCCKFKVSRIMRYKHIANKVTNYISITGSILLIILGVLDSIFEGIIVKIVLSFLFTLKFIGDQTTYGVVNLIWKYNSEFPIEDNIEIFITNTQITRAVLNDKSQVLRILDFIMIVACLFINIELILFGLIMTSFMSDKNLKILLTIVFLSLSLIMHLSCLWLMNSGVFLSMFLSDLQSYLFNVLFFSMTLLEFIKNYFIIDI